MFSIRCLLMLSLPVMLMGCAYLTPSHYFQNRDKQYLAARSIPPLKVPPGVVSTSFSSSYPVSDRSYPEREKDISVVPPGLN